MGYDFESDLLEVQKWYQDVFPFKFSIATYSPGMLTWKNNNLDVAAKNYLSSFRKGAKIVSAFIPADLWGRDGAIGFASLHQKKALNCCKITGEKRKKNSGWANNSQIAGTARHEISHNLFQLAGKEDQTHYFDYIEKNFDLIKPFILNL